MRLPVKHAPTLAALLLAASSGVGAQARTAEPIPDATGPAADYPVVVGEPFMIGVTTWTPADQLNYDAVGQASMQPGLVGVSGAHKTLPLPSYIEVTALDTGRTILVRLVERGPMRNDALVALSPEAATQLGLAPDRPAPVRVRRVNPPELERAALRSGGTVPPRMETPESLLKVLRRKLAEQSSLAPPPSVPPEMPRTLPTATLLSKSPIPMPAGERTARPAPPIAKPKPSATPQPVAAAPSHVPKGATVVQVAAFSEPERARKVAAQLGGQVSPAGRFWRVRLGPFKLGGEAARALEKARAAGYRDARIQRAD